MVESLDGAELHRLLDAEGEAAPDAAKKAAGLKEKVEASQALKDSLAYCALALEGIDDAKVLASPQMTYSLLHVAVHNNEIYGNIGGIWK